MPKVIAQPTRIPVPGSKLIDEYVGGVNTGDSRISIAHMRSPAGWSEPGQTPEFDEYTVVLKGMMRVEHAGGVMEVEASVRLFGGKRKLVQRVRDECADLGVRQLSWAPDTWAWLPT